MIYSNITQVRKYVNYRWGRSNLDIKNSSSKRRDGLLADPFCGVGSLHKIKQSSQRSSISHDKMADTVILCSQFHSLSNVNEEFTEKTCIRLRWLTLDILLQNFVLADVYAGVVKPKLACTTASFLPGTCCHSDCEHVSLKLLPVVFFFLLNMILLWTVNIYDPKGLLNLWAIYAFLTSVSMSLHPLYSIKCLLLFKNILSQLVVG